MKFRVYGFVPVGITVEVDAEDESEAIDMAYESFGGLHGYAGNGGTGKLIGTSDRNVFLDSDGEVEFTEAERATS